MKAVVCVPGGAEVADVKDPVPAPHEVVVEVEACRLCGSDVHAIELGVTAAGEFLGHGFAGRVVDVGASVSTGWIGQAASMALAPSDLVVWLLSDEASSVSGSTHLIDAAVNA